MKTINSAIVDYNKVGLCCLPASKTRKLPTTGKWKEFQKRLPTQEEINSWTQKDNDGLCLICGKISDNLEIIDFDSEAKIIFPKWKNMIPPDLLKKLTIETTPRGGVHLLYKCNEIEKSQKLAQQEEKKQDDEIIIETLIETRGEAGLCLVSPGHGYSLKHGDICNLSEITSEEREVLLSSARTFNKYIKPQKNYIRQYTKRKSTPSYQYNNDGVRPGDDYNDRHGCAEILTRHGWTQVSDELWCRPGKSGGVSGQLFADGGFICYTTSSKLETHTNYTPFALLTELEYGGDFSAAAQTLRQQGYGSSNSNYSNNESGTNLSNNIDDVVDYEIDEEEEEFSEDKLDDNSPIEMSAKTEKFLYEIPGMMGEMMKFCQKNAPYPNKTLSLAGALSMQSYLCGKKVSCMEVRPNLYILALAPSGSGKEFPRQVNAHIMRKINRLDSLGDKFASGEGIIDALINTGAMLFQNDEFDGILRQLKSDKDSKMESIPSILLSLYTSANTHYPIRVRSGGRMRHIDQPHLTIFGTATPSGFYESLSQRMLTGGLFARMIIFDIEARGQGQNQGKLSDMPDSIINQAWHWANFNPSGQNKDNWRNNSVNDHEVYDIPVLPEILPKIDYLRRLMNTEYDEAMARGDEVAATSWSRYLENSIKLAMLYACSRNCKEPAIDEKAMGWGALFMHCQISRQLQMTKSYNSVSPFHADCQKFLRLLKKAKSQKMSRSKLLRDMRCRAYDFDQIVNTLRERKDILVLRSQAKTKPTIFYALNKKGCKR